MSTASQKYRLATPNIRSTSNGTKIVVHYRSTLSQPVSTQSQSIMTNNDNTNNRKTLLDRTKIVKKTYYHVTSVRWWFVLPCLVIIALASSATSLLNNDLLVYRYEVLYGIQGTTNDQQSACRQPSTASRAIYYWLLPQFIPRAPQQHQQTADYNVVQRAVAQFNVKNSLVTFIPSLISFVLLGANCDTIGRRPMLLLPFIGRIVNSALMLIVVTRNLSDAWILLAHGLEAAFGSAGLIMLSGFAFITDCTLESNRTRAFLLTELVLVITRVGPTVGLGVWLHKYAHSYVAPLIVSLVLSAIGLAYVLFIQPESVQSV
jgi:hypothetical protein